MDRNATHEPDPLWTERKRQVLELLARERTNSQIAEELGLSLAGVKWHVSEVLSILGVDSREDAAAYWRSEHSIGQRFQRLIRALIAPVISWKAVAGTTGLTALAGTGIVVASLSGDGAAIRADDTMPSSTAIATPPQGQSLTYLDILTTDLGNGDSVTMAASLGDFLCFRESRTSWSAGRGYGCYGKKTDFTPTLLMQLGGGRPALYRGSVASDAVRVEVESYDGTISTPQLVAAPAALDLNVLFWAVAVPQGDLVKEVRSFDANGVLFQRVPAYDPPGTPPRIQISAPLRELVQIGSNRPDPNSGTIPFSGSRPGAIADPAGGHYRFSVEHDGSGPLVLILWCQTGVISLQWESGPDPSGNGIVGAQIPPDSAGCFFIVDGGDGTHRISTVSGP